MNTKQMGIKRGPALVTALLWAAIVLPIAATSAVAQKAPEDAKQPQIKVAEPEHDFGEVWYGPKLEHTYKITNNGTAPLDIVNVKPSCGCTKKGKHPKSIAPGETGEFAFTLDTKKLRNAFTKTIRVTTNDPGNKQVILKLKGVVKRYVDVEPISASFGKILGSEPRERELKITNNTDKTLVLTLPKNASDGKFGFELEEIDPGKSFLLRVSTKPPYSPGRISKKIKLATNVKEQPELDITVAGIVPERIEVKPSPLIISKTTRRIPRLIQVTNYGDTPVKILDATIDEPGVTLVVEEREAGKSYRIKVNLPQGYTPPAAGRTIVLKTDDAEKPVIRIPVKAPPSRVTKRPKPKRPVEDLLGKPAPAFELVTLAGEKITNKDGKVTVLNFFAPNCGYCKKQIPRLDKIRQQYEDKGVRFVNVREVMRKPYTKEATLEILEKTGSKIALAMDSDSNTVGGLFKARGFPTMVVLGKTGKVEYANVGNVGDLESRMKIQLDSLLDPSKPRWKNPASTRQTAKKPKSRRPVQELVGKAAPAFSGTTLAGKPVSNSTVAKEITVLNFFAGNCGFCKKQIPRLDTIRKDYESKGVRFINVSQSMRGKKYSDEEIVAIVEKTGAKMELLTDPDNKIGGPFKAVSFPTMVVLGKSGKVEYANVGNVADLESRMKVQLDSLLDPTKPRWKSPTPAQKTAQKPKPRRPVQDLVGKPAPKFSLTTFGGDTITNTDGKVTVLNFFAPNCGYCKKQIPRLDTIRKKYESKGVRFVNVREVMRKPYSKEETLAILEKTGSKIDVAMDDDKNTVGKLFKARGFPTMVVIGKTGKVEYANVGNVGDLESRMEVQLDSLLDTSKPRWMAAAANTARPNPTPPSKPALQLIGKPIPLFRALTIKDKPVTTTTAEEEVTVLNFFASNCPHCKKQIPRLEKIRQEFEGKGVRFVNVCQVMRGQTSSDDQVVSLLEGLGAKSEIVNDPRNKVGKLFDSTTYPTMVVLGKSGKIQGVTVGNVADLEVRARNQINAALGLNAGASAKPIQTGRRVTIGDTRK